MFYENQAGIVKRKKQSIMICHWLPLATKQGVDLIHRYKNEKTPACKARVLPYKKL